MAFTPYKFGAALLALAITAAPLAASAEPGGPHNGWNRDAGPGPGGHMDNRGGHGGPGGRGFDRPPPPPPRHFGRGGPDRSWHRGDRYDGGGYYVDNWRGYNGLYAPPNGYRWINYGGTFLLTAIATGVISNIIANQAYGGGY